MKKILSVLLAILLTLPAISQKESFDIASFIPPAGWQRIDSNGAILFQDFREKNGAAIFGQILLFPSRESKSTAIKNFQTDWNRLIAKSTKSKAKPITEPPASDSGWTVIRGHANITQQGVTYTCILITVSGFGRVMSIMANIVGEEYLTQLGNFLGTFEVDEKTTTPTAFDWSHYSYTAPENWLTYKEKDYILLAQSQSGTPRCSITILSPQPSSGNLETDAKSIFNQMYSGWQYRNTGEKQYELAKGYTSQGLEYCMMEGLMQKSMTDGTGNVVFEDGTALVIKAGNKIAIIAIRHATLMMAHIDCRNKYETWRRFFNSFTIKNQAATKNAENEISKRIIGVWKLSESGPALGEYIFAANGHYQFGGVIGTSVTTSDYYYKYIQTTAYSFQGDGRYAISGNQLTLKKHAGGSLEQVRFRLEKVSYGGTAWKDRLYMLKINSADGKEYEVRYEKSDIR